MYAVAPALTGPLTAGTKYYSAKMTINSAKTVGTGSCAGCAQKVCIVLNSIRVTQPVGVGDQLITAEGTSRIRDVAERSRLDLPPRCRCTTAGVR